VASAGGLIAANRHLSQAGSSLSDSAVWRQAIQGRLFNRTTQEPAGEGDLFPLFEIKEMRDVAASDRNAVAKHPVLRALVMELELLGFSEFAIAEGLALKANEVRRRGQARLTE